MRAKLVYLILGVSLAFCAAADEALSSDFLEFLGNGSRLGDQWIDPMSFHESPEVFASMPSSTQETTQQNKSTHDTDSPRAKEESTPPRNDDGGNEHD
jgi:hypothetical protein